MVLKVILFESMHNNGHRTSRTSTCTCNAEIKRSIWPNLEPVRGFIVVLVICKFHNDSIKTGGTIAVTRSKKGFFFCTQNLIRPNFELVRDFNSCPGYLLFHDDSIKPAGYCRHK